MAQLVVYPSQDGCMRAGTDAHFSNARDAGSADAKYVSEDYLVVGLNKASASPVYRFYRSYLYFDTSSLPDSGITITSATLQLYQTGSPTIVAGGVDVFLMDGQPTYPSATLALADFDRTFYGGGLGNPINVVSGASGYITLTLSQAGIDAITATGTTKFCLMSGRDLSYTIPWINMYAEFYSVEKGSSYRPILTINYSTLATVTTQAASGETASSATGNGNITDLGDTSVTAHGMIYSVGADPVNLATAEGSTDEGAAGATGAFTSTMSGLSASTTYQCRAYATNTAGTSYGDAVEFTTSAAAAVLTATTSDPAAITDTTATGNGSLSKPAGDAYTYYGFVWAANADPGTPADPTTAEAYIQTGGGSDGAYTRPLTGMSVSTRYGIRAFGQTDLPDIDYGDVVYFWTAAAATTTSFYGHTGDGHLGVVGAESDSVAEARSNAVNAAVATGDASTGGDLLSMVGTLGTGTVLDYKATLSRGYLYFDTSAILSTYAVTAVDLYLYVESIAGSVTSLYVYDGQSNNRPTSSGLTPGLVVADFNLSDYSYIATTGGMTAGQYNSTALPIATITPESLTKLMLLTPGECEGPFGYGRGMYVYSTDKGTTYRPYLSITYYVPTSNPWPGVNIGDEFKPATEMKINIGDAWKDVVEVKINIGDTWKDLTT